MTKIIGLTSTLLLGALNQAACSAGEAGVSEAEHRSEVMEWRAGRLERLLAATGYLNQTGLYWLEPGTYRFGTANDNDVVLSGAGDAHIGVFEVDQLGVTMRVVDDADVRHDGVRVSTIEVSADTSETPVMLTHRSLAWSVVERVGRFGVRLRDFEHPFVADFGPLPYFDIDSTLRVQAILRRYDEPVIANVATVIEGLDYRPESPGVVEFEIDGEAFQLEAYTSGDLLFFVFGDLSNRDATYGAGRFLYAQTPGADGMTILDFNKAYSPPCAFNEFSTCPVASPRNRLPIRVEAGEKYTPDLHYAASP